MILLCAMANASDSNVVAFDKANGAVKWQRKFPDMAFGHSTPVIISVKGKPQMLVLASGMKETGNALRSLDPASGKPLWWCRVRATRLRRHSGPGSFTSTADEEERAWPWTPAAAAMSPQPMSAGPGPTCPRRSVLPSSSVPTCIACTDRASSSAGRPPRAKQVYTERLPHISTTWASPVADGDGRLYFANAGKSYVIQSGPEFRILAVNDLGDGNHPSPAVAQGRLFLVGLKNLYCIGQVK